VSLKRYAAKRDENESGIVAALRAVGAHVTIVSGAGAPDLLVHYSGRFCRHCNRNAWALEVKGAKGKRTKAQETTDWPIVRSTDDALKAIKAG
jgi:hypothetical protein